MNEAKKSSIFTFELTFLILVHIFPELELNFSSSFCLKKSIIFNNILTVIFIMMIFRHKLYE